MKIKILSLLSIFTLTSSAFAQGYIQGRGGGGWDQQGGTQETIRYRESYNQQGGQQGAYVNCMPNCPPSVVMPQRSQVLVAETGDIINGCDTGRFDKKEWRNDYRDEGDEREHVIRERVYVPPRSEGDGKEVPPRSNGLKK